MKLQLFILFVLYLCWHLITESNIQAVKPCVLSRKLWKNSGGRRIVPGLGVTVTFALLCCVENEGQDGNYWTHCNFITFDRSEDICCLEAVIDILKQFSMYIVCFWVGQRRRTWIPAMLGLSSWYAEQYTLKFSLKQCCAWNPVVQVWPTHFAKYSLLNNICSKVMKKAVESLSFN